MKITIGSESMNVKDSDWVWVCELEELGRGGKIGDFSRRLWTENKEMSREWWKAAPLWFRRAAGPILGGKFLPKPKVSNNPTHSDLIMDAIQSFTTK